MTHAELLQYASIGCSDRLSQEQGRLEVMKSEQMQIASQAKIDILENDFGRIQDLRYTEETGETR